MKKKLILIPLLILVLVATLAIGCAGEQGIKGLKGDTGEQGIQGEQGERGIQGKQGIQGVQGEQGEVGLQGVIGRTGAKGAAGPAGATGEQGIQGEQGIAGVGYAGPAGPQGPAGSDAEFPIPVIDGVIDSWEWSCATVIPVANGMGNVSVVAYPDYLYMMFAVVDDTDAREGQQVGNDKLSVNINPTLGEPWGMPCDIIFETGTDPAAWPIGPTCGQIDGYETNWVIEGAQATLPGDLEAVTNYTGIIRVTEWKIPLNSIGSLSAGDILTLGGACDALGLGTRSVSDRYPLNLSWSDVTTYMVVFVR